MPEERYNGWTNRETWNSALWISNEEPLYDESRRIVREALREDDRYPDWTAEENRSIKITHAGDALKEWWGDMRGEMAPDLPGPISDAWQYAVDRTDWREIAENIADEIGDGGPRPSCPHCGQMFRRGGNGLAWHLANRTGKRACKRGDKAA